MIQKSPSVLDQLRDNLKHYSIPEEAYADWVRRFILHHRKRHPKEMGRPEVHAFLTHLGVTGEMAAYGTGLRSMEYLGPLFGATLTACFDPEIEHAGLESKGRLAAARIQL